MSRIYQKQQEAGVEVHPIVQWIWQQINERKLSQQDVAADSDVDPSTMRKWRDGLRSPRLAELDAVVKSLGYRLRVSMMEDRE
jgi:transcriptional regulator with XRE-family HTH domain